MTTYDEIMEEIKQEIEQGQDLDSIKDRAYEYVDNYVPVYNNRIIEEWQEMPGDYDDRGAAELGHREEITIIGLMTSDLYIYYTELVDLVLSDLEEELESVEE
jgi:hypothetical protein